MKQVIIIFLIAGSFLRATSQPLVNHLWKNRILIISSPDSNSELVSTQLTWLMEDTAGVSERKLLVYLTKPGFYKRVCSTCGWNKSHDLHSKYHITDKPFTVTLIGLDGGLKHTQNDLISLKKLFDIIDAMPMRKSEIKRKTVNQKNGGT